MARSRYKIIERSQPHFLTCTVLDWIPLFMNPEIVEIIFGSLRFLQQEARLTPYAYVIMENHIHLVASADDLGKEIGDFKSYTAREIIEYLKVRRFVHLLEELRLGKLRHRTDRTYQVWQEGVHPELIQGQKMMRQKIEYIHANPVSRGYVDDPTHWRYSSARNYNEEPGLLEVVKEW